VSDRMHHINEDRTFFLQMSSGLLAVTIGALLFAVSAMAGCAAPRHETRAVNESPDRYVGLYALKGRGQDTTTAFAHPIVLSEREWARLLDGLYVRPLKKFLGLLPKQDEPSLAFDDDDRRYLATYLSEAFVKARPDERVVFYLSRNRELHVTEITSGGLFVQEARLHLVMANYLQPVSMAHIRQQIRNDPLHAAGDAFYTFVPQHDQTVQTGRWGSLTQHLLDHVPELVVDHRAFLSSSDKAQAGDTSGKSEGGIGHGEGVSVEETLRELKRIHEQGTISDEEYQLRLKNFMDAL
jgi:hypothetical protein